MPTRKQPQTARKQPLQARKRPVKSAGTPEAQVSGVTPSPRRIRLNSIEDISREIRRCYREARSGILSPSDLGKFTFCLIQLASLHEGATFEARLSEMERTHAATESSKRAA